MIWIYRVTYYQTIFSAMHKMHAPWCVRDIALSKVKTNL